jgi:hypothetical protein
MMKHYKDANNKLFGIAEGQPVPAGLTEITMQEVEKLGKVVAQSEFDSQDYYRKRIYSYPEIGEFVDAWVKGDEQALEEYKQKCLEVKAKYPKPEGF